MQNPVPDDILNTLAQVIDCIDSIDTQEEPVQTLIDVAARVLLTALKIAEGDL